jgi:hypothetical protein
VDEKGLTRKKLAVSVMKKKYYNIDPKSDLSITSVQVRRGCDVHHDVDVHAVGERRQRRAGQRTDERNDHLTLVTIFLKLNHEPWSR